MFFNLQLIRKTIERAEKYDLSFAIRELFKDLGVFSISKKGDVPVNGPLLIISNHTGVFDSLLFLSQVERNDYYFIALSTYESFGVKVKDKLLPIFRTRHLNHKIYEYPLNLQINKCLPKNLTTLEIRSRNRNTISKAAGLINKGYSVSIFPTGSAGKSLNGSQWKAGIGFLVKQISNPQTKVVFVQINGTRQSDIVAYLHPFLSKLLFKPRPLSIQFSESYFLDAIVDHTDDAKTITKKLENLYQNQWK